MIVSVIIPCKKRLAHLKKTFPNVLRQSHRDLDIIVVDYMCPQGTSNYIERVKDYRVQLVKAKVGADDWNLSASRNLGYRYAKGEVLLFIDADSIIDKRFISDCLSKLKEGSFLCGNQQIPYQACGCCMVYKSDFEKVKGYNEVVEGWGSEDFNFYNRLEAIGLKNEKFNYSYIKNIPHSDSIRNEYHGKRDRMATNHDNYTRMEKEFKGI